MVLAGNPKDQVDRRRPGIASGRPIVGRYARKPVASGYIDASGCCRSHRSGMNEAAAVHGSPCPWWSCRTECCIDANKWRAIISISCWNEAFERVNPHGVGTSKSSVAGAILSVSVREKIE